MLQFLSHFFSFPCPNCKEVSETQTSDNAFCADCMQKLPQIYPPYCKGCGGVLDTALDVCTSCLKEPKRPWDYAIALFHHQDPVQNMIHQFKYRQMTVYARAFSAYAVPLLPERWTQKPDVIVSIPIHWIRFLQRGYNQSDLFAQQLARGLHLPMAFPLKRAHFSRHQMTLDLKGRKRKLSRFFTLRDKGRSVKGKRVLLVDDVFTTGATLTAATRLLKLAGALSVTVLVISRR